MKYLNKFNIINKYWVYSFIDKLDYKREDDIRDCFMGLLDMGLSEERFEKTVCDSDFKKRDVYTYNSKPLYPSYRIILTSEHLSLNKDYLIRFMDKKAEFLERLKNNGYKFNIINLEMLSLKNREREMTIIYDFIVYHPDDKIPWEIISDSKK